MDQIFASDLNPGPSKQPDDLPISPNTHLNTQLNIQTSDEPMETDFYGPALPPQFSQKVHSKFGSDPTS